MSEEPEPRSKPGLDEKNGWRLIYALLANPHKAPEVRELDPEDLPLFDQRLWLRAIQRIDSEGREPNMVAVADQLDADGTLEDLGGAGEPSRLADLADYVTHFGEWIRSIRKAATRRRLDIETMTLRRMLADSTVPNEEIAERMADAAKILTAYSRGPKVISLEQLIAENPTLAPAVIEGRFRRGEIVNAISKSKVGKSWFTYGMGLCVAAGWDHLGCHTNRGPVMFIDNELPKAVLANRIPQVQRAMGMSDDFIRGQIDILSLREELMSIQDLESVFRTMGKDRYSLVVLDAMYRMLPDGMSENDNAAMAQVYNRVNRYAAMSGAAIVIVHHSSKGSQDGKDVVDVGSGAGSMSRAADTHLVLRAHEEPDAAVLEAAVRSWPPVSPQTIRWTFPIWQADENLDPEALKGKKPPRSERLAVEDTKDQGVILANIQSEGPGTVKKLIERVGISRQRLERLLGQLRRDGKLTSKTVTIRGNDCEEYRLPV